MSRRIPPEFINSLLAKVDIVDIVGARTKLQKKGANHMGPCPFHHEKTASFSVSQPKQFYYCFGCAASGNAIGFLMEYDNLSFVEAVEELAHSIGMEVPKTESDSVVDKERMGEIEDVLEVLARANNFFQKQLRSHPDKKIVVDYLKNRGLSGETAQRYNVGYAPKGWDNLIKEIGDDPKSLNAMNSAGLVVKNEQGRHYDRFRGRVMFPIRDRRGRVIGFGARAIDPEDQPKYLNSPETPVFHKGRELYGLFEMRRSKQKYNHILITEGYMDVIGVAQYGIENAVATLGTATTKTHIETLLKQCPHLIFCYDGDRAGREAAWRALSHCLSFMTGDYRMDFLFLPDGEDPDSIVRLKGVDAFQESLKSAKPLSTFLLDHIAADKGLESLDARANFVKSCVPYLNQIPQGPFLDLILDQIASMAKTGVSQVRHQVTLLTKTQEEPTAASVEMPASHSLAEYLISWIVQYPELALALEIPDLDTQSGASKLLVDLITYIRKNPGSTTGSIIATAEFESHQKRLAQLASVSHPVAKSEIQKELLDCISRLQAVEEERVLNELIEKSRGQALSGEEKQKIDNLLRKNRH